MNTCFENNTISTYEQNLEWARFIYSKNVRNNVIIWSVLALFLLVLWIWDDNWAAPLAIGYAVFVIVRTINLPRNRAKKYYERKLAYYDGTMPPATYLFFEDHFRLTDVDSSRTAYYAKIEKVEFLKSCFAITLMDGDTYLVANSGFTKGTLAEFREFIRNKCPRLNLPEWQW